VQAGLRNRVGGVAARCEFTGYLNHDKAIEKAASCSILLLVIPKVEANKGILTGKIFEYLALKRPILAIGPVDGDAAQILNETGAGKMFDYSDVNGISLFLQEKMNEIQKGEQLSDSSGINKYSRRALTGQLARILEKRV